MDDTQVQQYIDLQKSVQNGTVQFVMKDMTIARQDLKVWSDSSTHLSSIGVT
jgi:hypothetical protein